MQRTTNGRFRRAPATAIACFAALFSVLLTPVSAIAADLQLGLALQPAGVHMPHRAPTLRVALTWPDSCLPTLDRVAMTGDRIDIVLRAGAAPCTAAPTPFEVVVDPARASAAATLEPRVYSVRVHLGRGGNSPELVAFGLIDASGSRGRITPENGFWWSVPSDSWTAASLNGSGISIERQDDRIAITLLGYEAGSPAWYFGSTTITSSVARVALVRMSGGGEPFSGPGAMPAAQPGPVLNLRFETPARARAWLERKPDAVGEAIELQEIALERVPFTEGPPGSGWRGTWILVEGSPRSARLLELTRLRTSDADTFRLTDAEETLSLDCRIAETGAQSHPVLCTLDDRGNHVATLDKVGLDRMSGFANDGSAVQIVRLQD